MILRLLHMHPQRLCFIRMTSTNPSCASVLHSQYGKFIMKHLSLVRKTSGCRRHSSSCSDSYQLTINVSAPVCPFPRVSVRRSLFLLTPSWARMEIAVPPVLGVRVDFQVRAAFYRDSISFCSRILTCRRGGVGGINPTRAVTPVAAFAYTGKSSLLRGSYIGT